MHSSPPDDQSWPSVTVAVLAYNRREAVRTTLAKLTRELDYPPEALEILVVDNASEDGTAEMVGAEHPTVPVVRLERNVGVSGWNAAFPVARGEWFLLVDDDCYLEGDALKRSIAAARAQRADLVSFRVKSGYDESYYFNDEYDTGLLSFWGCASLVSRRAVERVGGYDPFIFIWANELDFTLRLLDAGYRHLFLPEVVAVHMKEPLGDFPARADRMNRRHWAYVAAKSLRPLDGVRVVSRMIASVGLDPRTRAAGAPVQTLRLLLGGAWHGLRNRRPARAAVSAAYRDNFFSFANPALFLRRPHERLRAGVEPADRSRLYRERRPRFYPAAPAVLEL